MTPTRGPSNSTGHATIVPPKESYIAIEAVDGLAHFTPSSHSFQESLASARSLGRQRHINLTIAQVEPGKFPLILRLLGNAGECQDAFATLCAFLVLAPQAETQVSIGQDVLVVRAKQSQLEVKSVGRKEVVSVTREWFLTQWCNALMAFAGEGLKRLSNDQEALQIFSLDWQLTSVLYRAAPRWFADKAAMQTVFPLDPPAKTLQTAPLSELLKETLGHGPIVPYADEARAQQTPVAYWIGGDAPKTQGATSLRVAHWLASAPAGGHLWMLDGDRFFVVRKSQAGVATFIDTWNHHVPSLSSRELVKERLQRFLYLSESPGASFVLDAGELRAANR